MPYTQALQIFADILEGLSSLEKIGLVHFDLKPESILIKDGRAFIGDYGCMCLQHAGDEGFGCDDLRDEDRRLVGSAFRQAPDVSIGTPTGPSNHIWAAGLVLAEVRRLGARGPWRSERACMAGTTHARDVETHSDARATPETPSQRGNWGVVWVREVKFDRARAYPAAFSLHRPRSRFPFSRDRNAQERGARADAHGPTSGRDLGCAGRVRSFVGRCLGERPQGSAATPSHAENFHVMPNRRFNIPVALLISLIQMLGPAVGESIGLPQLRGEATTSHQVDAAHEVVGKTSAVRRLLVVLVGWRGFLERTLTKQRSHLVAFAVLGVTFASYCPGESDDSNVERTRRLLPCKRHLRHAIGGPRLSLGGGPWTSTLLIVLLCWRSWRGR